MFNTGDVVFRVIHDLQLKKGDDGTNKEVTSEKNETSVRKTGLSKEGRESSSGNIRHCACNAHSELCEGGARVSKKVMNPSHL